MSVHPYTVEAAINRTRPRSSPILIPPGVRSSLGLFDDGVSDDFGGANFDIGVDIDEMLNAALDSETFNTALNKITSFFGIGQGRNEADAIVPVQNAMMFGLDLITNQIRTGQNPSLATLQSFYATITLRAQNFIRFVLSSQFTDRRASGQALNTVMPYIDGSCGYAVPLGSTINYASTHNCGLEWGTGTIGGTGTDGMLGAISRAIVDRGGSTPGGGGFPGGGGGGGTTSMGFSTPLAVGLGLLVLFMQSKKRKF